MDPLLRLLRRLQRLVRRDRFNADLAEEMEFHHEQAKNHFLEKGMHPEDAHYAAIRQFGNSTRLAEQSHEIVGFSFESAFHDLAYSARQFRRNPGFALVLAVSLFACGVPAWRAAHVDPSITLRAE